MGGLGILLTVRPHMVELSAGLDQFIPFSGACLATGVVGAEYRIDGASMADESARVGTAQFFLWVASDLSFRLQSSGHGLLRSRLFPFPAAVLRHGQALRRLRTCCFGCAQHAVIVIGME